MTRLRTVFMGTPEVAVPSLRVLARSSDLALVVTQPDRPRGRSRKPAPPPVKVAAAALGLEVWQPERLRAADAERLPDCDLIVVLAFGQLLPQAVLERPRIDSINLHASLLPRWRGASPLQAAIRAGDSASGVCVMRMVEALDAGPVYRRRVFPLPERVDLPWLHDRIAEESAAALGEFLADDDWGEPEPQDDEEATKCGKLGRHHGHLDPQATADELDRWVRAYTPVPGCWMADEAGQRLGIDTLVPFPGAEIGPPGAVAVLGGRLLMACADGAVELQRIQAPGARAMAVRDFLNGREAPKKLSGPA